MKNLLKVLVVGLLVLTSCNKDESANPLEQDVFLGTFESTGGCIPNRVWEITITNYMDVMVYQFRCETASGFETRRYKVFTDEDDIFDVVVQSPTVIHMTSDKPAFRCVTHLNKVK